uniref:Uncharacterized protein n=1 Tax=Salmo trutta TaxID=8032 RepID=A0A673YAG7_SALTR
MVRIAVLQAQLQMQSLGKGNFSVGKDETGSVPPVSTDSSINPLAQSLQPDNCLMASGGKCCRNAQPVSLIQPTETFNRFSPLSNESESEAEPSQASPPPVTGSEPSQASPPPVTGSEPSQASPPPVTGSEPSQASPPPVTGSEPSQASPPPVTGSEPSQASPPPVTGSEPSQASPPPVTGSEPSQASPPPVTGSEPSQASPPPVTGSEPSQASPPPVTGSEPSQASPPPVMGSEPSQVSPPPVTGSEPSQVSTPPVTGSEPSQVSPPPVTGSETSKPPTISSDKLKTLVIGDSITCSIRLKKNHPATIHCLPGGRATDVKANLKRVLAKDKTGECREYRDIVIHVSTNDVRMKQSEVTKHNIASACKSARKMCRHRVNVSGPLPVRGSDELYSRVSQLNRWLKTFLPLPQYSTCR